MALNNGALLTIAFGSYDVAMKNEAAAYAGFVTTFLNNSVWAMPGATLETKVIKARMSVFATDVMGIKLETWQAYVGAVEGTAKKFGEYLSGRAFNSETGLVVQPGELANQDLVVWFDDIRDMSEQGAIDAIGAIMSRLSLFTGGEVRDWAKSEGFAPLDKAAVAAARKLAAAKKKLDTARDAATAWAMSSGTDSASDKAVSAASIPADPVAGIAAALATLTMEQRLAVQDALSTLLVADATVAAAATATIATVPEEIAVLSDRTDETAVKAKRAKRTVKSLADLATAA